MRPHEHLNKSTTAKAGGHATPQHLSRVVVKAHLEFVQNRLNTRREVFHIAFCTAHLRQGARKPPQ